MSLLERVEAVAERHPARVAIADEEGALDYAGLARAVRRLSAQLAPGELVASLLPSGPRFVALQLASLARGATFLPLPPGAKPAELRACFARAPASVVATSGGGASAELVPSGVDRLDLGDLAAPRRSRGPGAGAGSSAEGLEGIALAQPTSGSTGAPKLVLLDAGALEAGIAANADLAAAHAGEAVFVPVPQYHAMGGAAVLEHLAAGASVLVCGRSFAGTDVRRMQAASARLLVATPSYARVALRLRAFEQLPELRAIELGAAASEPELVAALCGAGPGRSVHLRYGLSEAFGALTRLDVPADPGRVRAGQVGSPRPGVELGPLPVLTEGVTPVEIRARGPALATTVIDGAGPRPLADAEGFLATGDAGGLDDAGGLIVRGRRSTFIKRNGHRVEPAEIEAVLASHERARDAVVVGLPDPVAGAKIAALVEGEVEPRELVRRCREHLADPKIPQRIDTVSALPRLPSGKPDRRAVLEALTQRRPA